MQIDSKAPLKAGIEYLKSIECHTVSHSKRTLLDHLIGTYNLLQGWDASESVCLAGLFHSVYGTEGFHATLAGIPDRKIIVNIIGREAEALAWLFGIRTNQSFWEQVRVLIQQPDVSAFTLVDRLTEQPVPCTRNQLLDVINLVLANAIDQVQHIPEHFTERHNRMFQQLLPFALPEAAAAFTKIFAGRPATGDTRAQSQAAGKQLA